jgi:intracellular septation protein
MMGDSIDVPSAIWQKLNSAWGLFFILLGFLNIYVASDYFAAEQSLIQLTGVSDFDLGNCAGQFQGNELEMCNTAQALEEDWVNFKLFGMMGLTMGFIVLQAFYLARHVKDQETEPQES